MRTNPTPWGQVAPEPGGGEMRHLLKRSHLLEEVSRSGYDLGPLLDVLTPQSRFVHPDYGHVASPTVRSVGASTRERASLARSGRPPRKTTAPTSSGRSCSMSPPGRENEDQKAILRTFLLIAERHVQEAIPLGGYPLGHRLFLSAVLARYLGGLGIVHPHGQSLQHLVGRDLHVLGNEGVPRVPHCLVGSPQIGDAFYLRRRYRPEVLDRRGQS